GRVRDAVVEVELLQPVEALAGDVAGEVELQRPLQPARGRQVGEVALVADADVLERLAARGEAGPGPGELHAEAALVRVGRPLGGPLRRPGGAAGGPEPGRSEPAGRLQPGVLLGREVEVEAPHLRE